MRKKTLWEIIKERLKEEISETQYNFWFKQVKGGDLETDHILRLECESEFAAEFIRKTFGEKLKRILIDEGYPMVQIKFEARKDGGDSADLFERKEKHKKRTSNATGIISRYTFDNFVPGKNSEMAFSAARAVAYAPGEEYNPLFIYGGVGLGKTHLLHAIGNDIINRKKNLRVLFITTEELISKIVDSIQKRKLNEFRNKIRSFDVLLIDDIHFISGTQFSQEELFHTFNYFYNEKKQIVFTADRPPWDLENVTERLVNRFSWGLVTDIKPPEYETRLAILKVKAKERGFDLPDEIYELIAKNVKKNVRLLESCIVRLHAIYSLKRVPITLELAKKELAEVFSSASLKEPEDIIQLLSEFYNIPKTEIMGKKQKKELTHARHMAMFIMKNNLGMKLTEIGRFFGKDHTTVINAIQKIEKMLQKNERIREELREIERIIRSM